VDPKELTRRLELCLIEQEVLAKHNIERTLRPVRTSSSQERTPPDATAQKKARPLTLNPDYVTRSLAAHPAADSTAKKVPTVATTKKLNRKSAPSLAQGSIKPYPDRPVPRVVLKDDETRLANASISQRQPSLQPRSVPNAKVTKPVLPQTEPAVAEKLKVKETGVVNADKPAKQRHRPKSLGPFVPQNAAKQLIQTATPNALSRESVHVLSLPVLDLYTGATSTGSSTLPSPLPLLVPISPLRASFDNSVHQKQSATTEKSSIDTTSSFPDHSHSASSAGYPSTTPSSVPPSSPPTTFTAVTQAGKHKSWNPRSLVAARKAKNDADEQRMGRNNFQDTSLMAGASQLDKAKGKTIGNRHEVAGRTSLTSVSRQDRRKTTAFEGFVASHSTPNLLETSFLPDDVPVPALLLPGDQKRNDWAQADEDDPEKKDGLWKRLRRRTLTSEPQPEPKQPNERALQKMQSNEHLRWKQLAMREKAIIEAKKPKEGKTAVVAPPANQKRADPLEVKLKQLQQLQIKEKGMQQQLVEDIQQQLVQEIHVEKTQPVKHVDQPKSERKAELKPTQVLQSHISTIPPTPPPTGAIPATPRTPPRTRKSSTTPHTVATKPTTKEPAPHKLPVTLGSTPSPPKSEPPNDVRATPSKGEPRPASPFTCPRPPPRIDSVQQKAPSPPLQTAEPQTTPRTKMAPSRELYTTPLRSRTPSIRSRPVIVPDGYPVIRASSALSTFRPKSSHAATSIPKELSRSTDRSMTSERAKLHSKEMELIHRRTSSSVSTGAVITPSTTSPSYRRISRFYTTAPPIPKSMNFDHVEKIPGMTPESVMFLKEQERLATERFGWPGRNFSMPTTAPPLRQADTTDKINSGEPGLAGDSEKKKKKQKWWKVWRS
jgi:hypothetical protein